MSKTRDSIPRKATRIKETAAMLRRWLLSGQRMFFKHQECYLQTFTVLKLSLVSSCILPSNLYWLHSFIFILNHSIVFYTNFLHSILSLTDLHTGSAGLQARSNTDLTRSSVGSLFTKASLTVEGYVYYVTAFLHNFLSIPCQSWCSFPFFTKFSSISYC